MANPFFVQPVNSLAALMAGTEAYDAADKRSQDQAIKDAIAAAGPDIASGNYQGALGKLAPAGSLQALLGVAGLQTQSEASKRAAAQLSEAMRHNRVTEGLTAQGLEGRPQDHVIEDAAGNKRIVRVFPGETPSRDVTPPELASGTPANPYAPGGKMTENEGKAALFADRAATSHAVINKYENINNSPTGFIGGVAEKNLPEGVVNPFVSNDRGLMMNAKRAFVNALLRRESGAAISSGEFSSYDKEYFPQPGDSPQQIAAKRMHRAEVISGLAREGGKAYRPNYSLDLESGNITRGVPPTINVPGVTAAPKNDPAPISAAREAIARGADPQAVAKRLRESGVKFNPRDLELN